MINKSIVVDKALFKKEISDNFAKVIFEQDVEEAVVRLNFTLDGEYDNEYVFFPACAYNGNRFDVLKKKYPPMFTTEETTVDMPITITEVPRLNKDGSGKIEITTGDVSVPCVGVYSDKYKKGILVFTTQGIEGNNFGISYSKNEISITYPSKREKIYHWLRFDESDETGISFEKGASVTFPYKIFEFDCCSIAQFLEVFFENRKCMGLDGSYGTIPPFCKLWEMHEDKFNRMNWKEKGGYYAVGTIEHIFQDWQPGWVGGGISSYPLLSLGNGLSRQRAIETLRHLFGTQTLGGFYYGITNLNGLRTGDAYGTEGAEEWHLIRKSADVLYYTIKHFEMIKSRGESVPEEFEKSLKKTADAFVRLWETYGQFGHFINHTTGEIAVGGSTSAAIAPAGLVACYRYYGEEKYLKTAEASAEKYYSDFVSKGYTTGGPGEILQSPDSESAFGILESYVELYEATQEEKWLKYAKTAAALCSSWVMAYNYNFPQTSQFARLDMKTIGTVFANVQNKHSAPGICTLSGSSLFKLFRFTKDKKYLELINDIARTIGQYMSTEECPIYSRNSPPVKLPQGFINERVNTSDWEGYDNIGEVFNGSCWSETANMLTIAELPSIYVYKDSGIVCCFDNISAELNGSELKIININSIPVTIKVFFENENGLKNNLGVVWAQRYTKISLNQGETKIVEI